MERRIFTTAALLLAVAAGANAHASGAHVHGDAVMHVVVDGNTLELELISPLDNLLGFEHAPRNDRQRKAVRDMTEKFRKPELLVVPTPAARCAARPAQVTSPLTDDGAKQAKADKAEEGHAELEAVISFQCQSPSALKGIEVKLFDAFPQLHRLRVQVVGPRGQSAATLTPEQPLLSW